MAKPRNFSATMQATNRAYLTDEKQQTQHFNVAFILLENFSMMAFTAAVDVLVTSNLMSAPVQFSVTSYSLASETVTSDLNIDIATNGILNSIVFDGTAKADLLIVCGGLRADLTSNNKLSHVLQKAQNSGCTLGAIWNGSIALAQAGVLADSPCALHINNHPLMQEQFPQVNLTDAGYSYQPTHMSCADALGSLHMMLALLNQLTGADNYRAVKEILACHRSIDNGVEKLSQHGDNPLLPHLLRNAVQLMNNNIEEPLAIDEIAVLTNTNRRQLERLFRQYLNTSPSKHYLEIRLTFARRLLVQSPQSITDIALACGFINSNHFSNCFRQYFTLSPSQYRKKQDSQG